MNKIGSCGNVPYICGRLGADRARSLICLAKVYILLQYANF